MTYLRRIHDDELDVLFPQVPAIAIDRPKAVGKTTTGQQRGAGPGRDGSPVGPQAGTMLGHLFESLAALCVRVAAQAAEATVGHLRARNGEHEVDLIVVRDDGKVLAVEVTLAATVDDRDTTHLHWLAGHLGDTLLDAIVLSTGPYAYRRPDGIGVVPLGLLGP